MNGKSEERGFWMPRKYLKLLLLFLTVLFIILFYSLYNKDPPIFQNGGFSWTLKEPSPQAARDAETDLRAALESPIAMSNFTAMGGRISKFSKLSEALQSHASLDRKPVISLLGEQFPWWNTTKSRYAPWTTSSRAETGLVMCVGSNNFLLAAHLISTLRNVLGSTLPIEVFYAGDDDLPAARRLDLKALGSNIETVDLLEYFDEAVAGLRRGGYAMKPFAALTSSFQRVILVDADVLFLQQPERLFEEYPGLIETGTLFWHDRAYFHVGDFSRRDWVKGLLAGKNASALLEQSLFWQHDLWQEMDSGVVCIDKGKSTAFMGLVFATWMNTEKVREEIVYKAVLGDKETYWLAHELSSFPYIYAGSYAGIIGTVSEDQKICSVQILHTDRQGKPFWFNGSLRKNKGKESREFASLTHWIPGAATWDEMLKWNYIGDNTWCGQGVVRKGVEYETVILRMIEEAKKVDEKFPA